MGKIKTVQPVKLIIGIISQLPPYLNPLPPGERIYLFEEKLADNWGTIDLRSAVIPFDYTDYYNEEMGANLQRYWVSFEKLIRPSDLPDIKIKTNTIEDKLAQNGKRTVNLDPGYIDGAKLVLASTKDYSHRIYLNQGIFAEVTLLYRKGWIGLDWTYPDYRPPNNQEFFSQVREKYLSQIH